MPISREFQERILNDGEQATCAEPNEPAVVAGAKRWPGASGNIDVVDLLGDVGSKDTHLVNAKYRCLRSDLDPLADEPPVAP